MSFSFIKNNPFFFFFSQTKNQIEFIHFYLNNPAILICSVKTPSAFFPEGGSGHIRNRGAALLVDSPEKNVDRFMTIVIFLT